MLLTKFSKKIDAPRLEHCRKSIFANVLWDTSRGQGRLDWAWIGENEICYEIALTNPNAIVVADEKMIEKGKYIFTFRKPDDLSKFKVTIEKFEIRKRLLGAVTGFRAEIALSGVSTENSYLISKSLPDLNQKLFGIFVGGERHEALDEQTSVAIMSAW